MTDLKELTPWLLGLIAMALGWLFKTVIQLGKDVVAVQTAFKYYLDNKTKGAAMVLDSDNPTPPDVRILLKKYYECTASKDEIDELADWLEAFIKTPGVPKSERSAAIDVLSGMGAIKILERRKPSPVKSPITDGRC